MTILGQPSTDPVQGYRLYYGTNGFTDCLSTVQIVSNVVEGVRGQTYQFQATAIGTNGLESVPSNQLLFKVP